MKYKTKPYKHQEELTEKYRTSQYGALFLEQGLGKTKIALDIIQNTPASLTDSILVLAPNGLHANWHYKELPDHLKDPACAWYWQGSIKTQKAKIEARLFFDTRLKGEERRFLFMNIEAVRTKNGFAFAEHFLKKFPNNMIIIDESSCIKNPKAKVTKACFKLAKLSRRRFILSGTPITQGPLDLFSQCKFLSESSIPYRTWTAYKATFAQTEICYAGNRKFNKIVGYKNLDHLTEILKPFSDRLKKADCLDLPEKIWQTTYVEMAPKQRQAYIELRDHALTILEESKGSVSSTLPLTTLLKLQQICSGFVKNDDGVDIPLDSKKLEVLMSIAESTKPLVIFCAFLYNIEQVEQALKAEYGKDSTAVIRGGDSSEERSQAVADFQAGNKQFIVCTSAGAKGITLTRASHMVYFSNNYSLETRLQSQDRIHRIGQKDACVYTDLVVQGSVDEAILKALHNKQDISNMVLDDLIQILKNV